MICVASWKILPLDTDCTRLCRMDGWMTCDFTSFLTVFQSYQDDV